MAEVLAAAVLEMDFDGSGVVAGMAQTEQAAERTERAIATSAGRMGNHLIGVGDDAQAGAVKLSAAQKNIERSLERQAAALLAGKSSGAAFAEELAKLRGINLDPLTESFKKLRAAEQDAGNNDFISSLQKQSAAIGKTKADLLELEAAQRGLSTQAAPFVARLRDAEKSLHGVGVSAGQTKAALAQLPAQFTDIGTQLAGGANPFLILIQQGGQIKDSFGGFGNALRGVASAIKPVYLGVGLLVGGLAAVALAYKSGAAEGDAYAKALILTGNAAGTTVGQLQATAKAISTVVGTQGKAAEVLASLAASGQVGSAAIGKVAEAAIRLEYAGGPAIEETVKQFTALGKDPAAAAAKLNEQTNFLTLGIYNQVKALQDQGKEAEAARVAQEAYANTLIQRSGLLETRLGAIEKAWRGVKDGAKGAWDAMLGLGREENTQSRLQGLQAQLDQRLARGPLNSTTGGAFEKGNEALRQQIAILGAVSQREELIAGQEDRRNKATAAGVELSKDFEKSLSSQAQLQKQLKAFDTKTALGREAAGVGGAEALAAFDADAKRQRTFIEQTSAAFGQSVEIQLAILTNATAVMVRAAQAAGDAVESQFRRGLLSEVEYIEQSRDAALRGNAAQIEATAKEIAIAKSKRENTAAVLALQGKLNGQLADQVKISTDADNKIAENRAKLNRQAELFFAGEREQNAADAAAFEAAEQAKRDALSTSIYEQTRALKDSNAELSLEANLIGQSSSARGVAIEQLRIRLQLERDLEKIRGSGFKPDERDQKIADTTANAKTAIDQVATKANVAYIADLLDPTRAKTFGEALTDAFEGAGNSLVKLINTLETFSAARIASEERLKSIRNDPGLDEETRQKGITALIEEQTKAQVGAYATMAGAAKGFFKENSTGYKTLEAIETGFRLAQIAGAIQTTAAKLFSLEVVTTATTVEEAKRQVALEAFRASELASDAAHAAASIAQSEAVGAASVAPAIAKEGSQSGLYGAIAMAAFLAALGYASAGGFDKTSGTQASAAQRQGGAATGRIVTPDQLDPNSGSFRGGTVFGDSEARSESIAKSIDILKDVARLELPIARSQLNALEAIRDSMAGLANLIVRSVGGALTTGKNFDVQTGTLSKNQGDPLLKGLFGVDDSALVKGLGPLGSFAGKLQSLWGKVTQKIADSGLEVSGTISDILVRQFIDIEKTSSSFFGLVKKTSTDTQFGAVEDQLAQQFALIFSAIGDTIKSSATVLGREGGDALAKAIESFPVAIERLSLKDLKGDELQDAISAAIGAQADAITQALVPGLEAFQTVGEGYFETLIKVSSGIELANYQLDLLGITAIAYTDIIRKQGDVGAEIVRQSIALAETAGGALSSVGTIVNTLSGTADDLAETYKSLIDVRTALIKVGESGETLTVAMIRGAGGLDKLSGSLETYFTEFFSEQEQLSANADALTAEFKRLGLAVPLSRDEFRHLITALNDGTDAGAAMAAKVLGLAGAFDEVADAAEEAAKRLTGSISDAISRFGTPQERQGQAFGGISTSLQRDAGVSVSIGQLIGASIKDINDFARAFLAVSTNSDAAKAALLDAANALFDLKKEAADQRGSLEVELLRAQGRELQAVAIERQAEIEQLRALEASLGVATGTFSKLQEEIYAASDAAKLLSGLKNIVPDFLSGKDLASFRAQQVQSTLAGAGINVSIDQILSATGKQIRELFEAVGPAGKQAIVDVYDEVTQLQTDLTKEQRKGLEDQIAGMKGLRDLAREMKDFVSTLKFGDLSPLSAEAQLTEAKNLFQSTLSKALGGDTQAQGNLQGVAQSLLTEAQSAFASGPGYAAIFRQVTGALESLGLQGDALDPQIKYLESLSDNSRSMLDALLSIDTTLKGGAVTPSGTGSRDYIDGPAGSSGGLSGQKGDVVDLAPARWADTTRQTELLEKTLAKLDEILASSKLVASAAGGNAAVDQLGFNKVTDAVNTLREPLDRLAGNVRQANNKAAAIPDRR